MSAKISAKLLCVRCQRQVQERGPQRLPGFCRDCRSIASINEHERLAPFEDAVLMAAMNAYRVGLIQGTWAALKEKCAALDAEQDAVIRDRGKAGR